MNIAQISDNLEKLVESFNKETFIFDLLLAYGTPKATISRLQQGDNELFSKGTVVIKKKLFFNSVINEDLQIELNKQKTSEKIIKQAPRFLVVTDYMTLLAYDTKTDESLDIPILEIPQYYDFFLPWAGMEKSKQQTENIADVKAAERMAKLYDEITKDNPTSTHEEVHNLNVFLSRLLFCYFAEDTGIFDKDIFTLSVDSLTQKDGSDLNSYLDRLFVMMNTPLIQRPIFYSGTASMPAYLNAFPYVNGGLFRNHHAAPIFTRKSRQMLIDCGLTLQWQDINPDIFGSMIQAVITPEHRGGLGMHYTSVPNIMKVIEPLFLDELKDEFENSKGNKKKLNELLQRIWKIKIFDPACGSGNFLIIAYKELRKLEMLIFKEIDLLNGRLGSTKIDFENITLSEINLSNFYGIELDDFAHEVATLSLWLAEHQMNQAFKKEFGRSKPSLPLQETGNILHGNACRVDWDAVCPKNEKDEIYILGNPPYLGARLQSEEQKADMELVFGKIKGFNNLDYISCWFLKGSNYIPKHKAQYAFVTTNSICQGEQVALLWPHLLINDLEISFAHQSFKWTNNAKANAGVIVAIIGLRNKSDKPKYIFNNNIKQKTENINSYLINGKNTYIKRHTKPISPLPEMSFGNMANDGGHLFFNEPEKIKLLESYPQAIIFIKKLVGAQEFIRGENKYCLWISDDQLEQAMQIPEIAARIENCRQTRLKSKRDNTMELATVPHLFGEIRYKETDSIIVPSVSSERREYIPMGYLNSQNIIVAPNFAIYEAELWILSMLTSKMHMSWIKSVSGKLKSDYRYSSSLCYNAFPFPPISDKQKKELEQHVYNIIGERAKNEPKTLAQLYDPDKMPDGLREAHHQNDLAVERCYRSKPFESDEERLEYLFKLYEQMIEEEKERGTLFGGEKKSKKKR